MTFPRCRSDDACPGKKHKGWHHCPIYIELGVSIAKLNDLPGAEANEPLVRMGP